MLNSNKEEKEETQKEGQDNKSRPKKYKDKLKTDKSFEELLKLTAKPPKKEDECEEEEEKEENDNKED